MKKSILLILFLMIHYLGFVQDIDKAFNYFDNEEFEKAAAEFELVLPELEAYYGADDSEVYAEYLLYTAVSYERIQDHSKAVYYYKKSKSIYESKGEIKNETYLIVIDNLASLYYLLGENEKALPLFIKAKDIFAEAYGTKTPTYGLLLNSLALVLQNLEEYDDAIANYIEAKEIVETNFEKEHPDYLIISENLALLYEEIGEYVKAIQIQNELLEIAKNTVGEEHEDYNIRLNVISNLKLKQEDREKRFLNQEEPDELTNNLDKAFYHFENLGFAEAAQLFELILPEIDDFYGDEDIELYAMCLFGAAFSFHRIRQYNKAEHYYSKAINLYEIEGNNLIFDDLYLNIIEGLARMYSEMGQYSKALPLAIKVVELSKEFLGKDSTLFGVKLNNLALLYQELGDFANALTLLIEALENAKRTLGEESSVYGLRLNNLAGLYSATGQYDLALPLYLEALENTEKTVGKTHQDYSLYLNNLAELYRKTGQLDRAMRLYHKALEVLENELGKEHPDYGLYLNNLASLYFITVDYDKALQLLLKSLDITKKDLGEEHPEYAMRLSNIALLYGKMHQFDKALQISHEALDRTEITLGRDHPDYGINLNNLATLYGEIGQYEEALQYLLEALEIKKNVFGSKHPDYGVLLNNLGKTYSKIGQPDTALTLYLQALENFETAFGKEHHYYGNTIGNIAGLYLDTGDYDKAIDFYSKALKIIETTRGDAHPNYDIYLSNLGVAQRRKGSYGEAVELTVKSQQNILSNLERMFRFLSEDEKINFSFQPHTILNGYHSFYLDMLNEHSFLSKESYNISLATSGMILSSSTQMRQSILENEDEELINQFNQWLLLNHQINHLLDQPIGQRNLDVDSLSNIANSLERDLVRNSQAFASATSTFQIKWEDVRDNLKEGESAVELISFNYHNGKQWTDSIYYCALILNKDMDYPEMIFLFEERELQELLPGFYAGQTEYNLAYQGARASGTVFFDQPAYRGKQLYELLWQPIDSILGENIESVYFAPTGLLHSVSFAAIPDPEGTLLMGKYNLVQVSSTRVVAMPENRINITDAVVFGGIDYNLNENQIKPLAQEQQQVSDLFLVYQPYRSIQNNHSGFSYLSGSLEEANTISAILSDHYSTTTFKGSDATEESFKALSGAQSPSIIHIATHGFYLPDTISDRQRDQLMLTQLGEDRFRLSDDPLMRSALVFAGANHTWAGKQMPSGMQDGILTAREVSSMNLSNTALVVLSACQTGLGDVMGSEGVSGLQRAFMMAGVRYIIMSLWSVPDKETAEFMEAFYGNWLTGMEIREAFNTTQCQMHDRYPNEPYKWAGFVIVK